MSVAGHHIERTRSGSGALQGRARGVLTGSLIALGWAVYGSFGVATPLRYLMLASGAAIALALVAASAAMIRRARSLPPATPAQALSERRAWRWFWLNFLAEVVLINVAIALLPTPYLRAFWIPAISAVVGVHFWPMAVFFRVRSYWWVGAAMIVAAVLVAVLVARHPDDVSSFVHAEGLVNALILWLALGTGAAFALVRRDASPTGGVD